MLRKNKLEFKFALIWLLLVVIIVESGIVSKGTYLRPDVIGCISHHEAKLLLELRKSKNISDKEEDISINLGMTTQKIVFGDEGILINGDNLIATWAEIQNIAKKTTCFALYDDGSKPWQISTISDNTDIPASLSPPLDKSGAPTLILGGFTMHRIVDKTGGDKINPTVDTQAKIDSIRINRGNVVLDTCMGLGYTAIGAAKLVGPDGKVITVEYDQASLEMSSYNPWSRGLFDDSLPVEIHEGDACEIIKSFETNSISCIIHDPPARALCRTDLYGVEFYKELNRVLRHGGPLFHYIGSPDSKESGRLYSGIVARMREAGFINIKRAPRAFGLVATGDASVSMEQNIS